MKKLFLSVAVLAAFASCSKNDVVEMPEVTAETISFSTMNDRVASRAASDNSANPFRVYARLSGTTSDDTGITAWYFSDAFAQGSGTVETSYIWPTTDYLDFLAVSPDPTDYTSGSFLENVTGGNSNIASEDFKAGTVTFTFKSQTGDIDLTASRAVDQGPGADGLGSDATTLSFTHLLSKVVVSVELGGQLLEDGCTINTGGDDYLTSALSVDTSRGIYTLSMDGSGSLAHPADKSDITMDAKASGVDVNVVPQDAVSSVITLSNVIINTAGGSEFYNQGNKSLTYTIAEGDINTYFTEAEMATEYYTEGDEADKFCQGKVYCIHLIIDENSLKTSKVTFTLSVEDWVNSETGGTWSADSSSAGDGDGTAEDEDGGFYAA